MIFKRSKPNKNTITNADKIVDNHLYVHSAWPTVKVDDITWKENPTMISHGVSIYIVWIL